MNDNSTNAQSPFYYAKSQYKKTSIIFFLGVFVFFTNTSNAAIVNQGDSYLDNALLGKSPSTSIFPAEYTGANNALLENQLKPKTPSSHAALSLALQGYNRFKSGSKQLGLDDLLMARSMAPNETEISTLLILTYIEDNKFNEALKLTKKIQLDQPNNPLGYTMMGIVHGSLKNVEQSKQFFYKALRLQPGNVAASWNLAIIAIDEGLMEKARKLYNNVLAYNPGHLETLIEFAKLEYNSKNISKSTSLMKEAVKKYNEIPFLYIILGKMYLSEGEVRKTLTLLEPVVKKFPENPEILSLVGYAYLKNSSYSKATQTLKAVIKISPENITSRYNLVIAYQMLNKNKLALQELNYLLKQEPNSAPFKFLHARLLARDGQLDASRKILLKLDSSIPDSSLIKELLGKIASAESRHKDASIFFQDALKLRESNSLILLLASAQMKSENEEASFSTLRNWIKKNPSDYVIINVLADYLLLNGHFDEAEKLYAEVVQISPSNAFAWNNLAWLLLQKGAINEAYFHSKRAIKLKPKDMKIMDIYGLILLERGEIDKATNKIRIAAKNAPNNLNIQFHLAKAYAQSGKISKSKAILKNILSQNRQFAESQYAQKLLESLNLRK